MKPIRYHEAAEAELLDEIGYLELRAKGLGRRFFVEVRRTEGVIAQFPNPGKRFTLASARPTSENSDTR